PSVSHCKAKLGDTFSYKIAPPPQPGKIPKLDCTKPNFVPSRAIRISHAVANSHPPPSAFPCKRAIVGIGNDTIWDNTSFIKPNVSYASCSDNSPCNSLKSPPEQKTPSPALLITKKGIGRSLISVSQEDNCLATSIDIAFLFSGRFKVNSPYSFSSYNTKLSKSISSFFQYFKYIISYFISSFVCYV